MAPNEDTAQGFWLAVSSYALWGVFPIYFYVLRHVDATEILAHRIIWSALLLLTVGYFFKKRPKWYQLLGSTSTLMPCIFSALFLSTNWLIYIWAVGNGKAVEGSLGYFINPLISVVMAVIFFGERLNKFQLAAIGFVVAGVCFLVFKVGEIPWIALALALSFGSYGLIHKKYAVDAFAGLTVETIIATPLALVFFVYLFSSGQNHFLQHGWQTDGLLLAAGVITSLPLLLYLASLPQLRLSSVGLLQYIAPTLQFLVAIYVLGEAFSADKFIAFCIIWLGLLIFSVDIIRQRLLKNKLKS